MLLSALAVTAAWIYCDYIRVQNVFDQMYFSRTPSSSIFSIFHRDRELFEDVPPIKTPTRAAGQGTICRGTSG